MSGGELLYLVGPPGSGKSTLVEYLTRRLSVVEQEHRREYRLTKDIKAGNDALRERPVYWMEYHGDSFRVPVAHEWGRLAEAATKRGSDAVWSRGTDRYDKCIHQWFFTWLEEDAPEMPLVIAEGDRLGYVEGLRRCEELGYRVTVAYLGVPEEVAEARRRARGSTQNPTWVKGRHTKALNVAEAFGAQQLDGTADLWALEWALRNHPTVAALRAARGDIDVDTDAF